MAAAFHPGYTPLRSPGAPRRSGALAAMALHGLAAAALLSYEPARSALVAAAPIMVELISAPAVQSKPTPPAEHPKPRPVAKSVQPPAPVPPSPLLAAPSEALPPAPAAPAPVTAARPAPPPAEPVVAAPVAIVPPVFNAAYLDNPAPAYPPLSRRMHEEGRVILRVLVTPAGTAEDIQVRASSGAPRLDAAALDTVRRWKFVPAKRGNEAVPAWVLIPISFKLDA
ncbi:MAG: TonB family protein [Proteobacteria bacterium]|nr:TonB family protein [Pseudomonadota bacterium]